MIVEGYTIHLYCDDPGHVSSYGDIGEFAGYRLADASREARSAGWRFFKEGGERKCRCPACVTPSTVAEKRVYATSISAEEERDQVAASRGLIAAFKFAEDSRRDADKP